MKKAVLIYNRGAGGKIHSKNALIEILEFFPKDQIHLEVFEVKNNNLPQLLENAIRSHPDIMIAAGGDGTVSAVASQLCNTAIVLGVLPVGTLNHFAKDLGLPSDIQSCAAIILKGNKSKIDVAELNGRSFINNSAVGFYPELVAERDQKIKTKGWNKWFSLLIAACKIWFKFPLMSFELMIEGKVISVKSPLVFIGNNNYKLEDAFNRPSLTHAILCVYILKSQSRLAILKGLWQVMRRGFCQAFDLEAYQVDSLILQSQHKKIKVAVDGELMYIAPPLRYSMQPQALWVIT